MKTLLATGTVVAFGLALGALAVTTQAGLAQTPSAPSAAVAARYPRNADEFDELFRRISNWGRWGKDDERGSANLVTDAKRKQAGALVKNGIAVSLAHNPLTEAAPDNTSPFEHTMNRGLSTDTYKVSYHGYAHSHIDALCHILYKDQTYNGYARAEVNTEKGCTKLGIQQLKNGVVTRGILIDIPRLRNLPYLEPGTPVYPEDLEAWEKKVGVKVGPGDAILLRTGRWLRREKVGPWGLIPPDPQAGEAGYHVSTVPWMRKRDVAFIAADVSNDVRPSGVPEVVQAKVRSMPVHSLTIVAMGAYIIDALDFEEAAEVAAKLNRYEFFLTGAGTAARGGTGSLLNLTAIF